MSTGTGATGRHWGQGWERRLTTNDRWEDIRASLSLESIATAPTPGPGGRVEEGNWQRDFIGVQIGRAAALATQAGANITGVGHFAADTIFAELDANNVDVFPLERIGKRLAHARPWKVGKNITLLPSVAGPKFGVVVRGASIGAAGLNDHYFITAAAAPGGSPTDIILHHRSPNPPFNSTVAYDPDPVTGIKARLSDALRIGPGPTQFCAAGTTTGDPTEEFWVYINATQHGGRFSGWFAAAFASEDAAFSFEVMGPLRPATKKHNLAFSRRLPPAARGRAFNTGAFDCEANWTRGNPKFDAPMEILDVEEPDVQEPEGFPIRVWLMHDKDEFHPWMCKPFKLPGKRRWHLRSPVQETPPCDASKAYATVDSNGNPERAFESAPSVYMPGGTLSSFIDFVPQPGILLGDRNYPRSP